MLSCQKRPGADWIARRRESMPPDGIQGSLKTRGIRVTRQRRILLDLIDRAGSHLDADQLYELAKKQDPKLNRVTVYRTLKMLKQGQLVDELDLNGLGFEGMQPEVTGRPAYHPASLLKIYIYGYLNRIQSSRRLERETQRNVACSGDTAGKSAENV